MKKGHSHQTIQQLIEDMLTSSVMSMPVRMVPPAKVIIDDMVNLSLRPGSPNPLMAAIESDKLSGLVDSKHKRQPQPPDAARAFMELPGEIGRTEFPMASSSKPTGTQPKTSQVTVLVSGESDFASDAHQVIPLEPCYGQPLGANASGSLKMGNDHAVQVVDFQGIFL